MFYVVYDARGTDVIESLAPSLTGFGITNLNLISISFEHEIEALDEIDQIITECLPQYSSSDIEKYFSPEFHRKEDTEEALKLLHQTIEDDEIIEDLLAAQTTITDKNLDIQIFNARIFMFMDDIEHYDFSKMTLVN